jgi:hypothetical protein
MVESCPYHLPLVTRVRHFETCACRMLVDLSSVRPAKGSFVIPAIDAGRSDGVEDFVEVDAGFAADEDGFGEKPVTDGIGSGVGFAFGRDGSAGKGSVEAGCADAVFGHEMLPVIRVPDGSGVQKLSALFSSKNSQMFV